MFKEEIIAAAAALSGIDDEKMSAAAAAAEALVMNKLKSGISPDSIRDTFIAAASLMTLAIYYSVEGETSFSAGDMSVTRKGGTNAGTLRDEACQLIAPYASDEGFSFLGVDG